MGKENAYGGNDDDFNPRSPRGLRPGAEVVQRRTKNNFNPRSPRGLRLYALRYCNCRTREISIHAAQEGCDQTFKGPLNLVSCISIHAAQEGCDCITDCRWYTQADFNPRSPRGLRPARTPMNLPLHIFQSTQPKRAATWSDVDDMLRNLISIHAAQEGCDTHAAINGKAVKISIHAAQEGCDYGVYQAVHT